MSTLAAPLGNTPQGAQVAAGNQQLLSSAGNTVQSGQTLDPATMNAAQTLYNTTAQNQANTQTPGARQGYLDNTNIASQQGNYDTLAKQLASYDQMVLQPQFQGSNPGAPSELNGLSGYVNPNLSYNSADTQTPDQTLYNANPTYGLNRQADQGNSIVNLLGTLNTLLSNESKRGTAKYTSDLSNMSSMLGTLNNIFGQNTSLTNTKSTISAENSRAAADRANQRVLEGIKLGTIDPSTGMPWGTDSSGIYGPGYDDKGNLLSSSDSSGNSGTPQTPQAYADSVMGGYTDWADVPDSMKPSVSNLVKKQGGNLQKIIDTYHQLKATISSVDTLMPIWQDMSPLEKVIGKVPGIGTGNSILTPDLAKIDNTFMNNILPGFKASIGGRLTNQEIQWFRSRLPGPGDTQEGAQAKIDALKTNMEAKVRNPDYTIGSNDQTSTPQPSGTSGTSGSTIMTGPDGKQYQVPNGKVGLFQQNGYK